LAGVGGSERMVKEVRMDIGRRVNVFALEVALLALVVDAWVGAGMESTIRSVMGSAV
jgi:NAD(P)H-hydrate repair Nnr-like enzyme with NAD(P)H-hydrate epimerase domain